MALRNVIKHTGVSLVSAFKMASTNPARAVGLDGEVGSLAEGKRANIVILDKNLEVARVILDGQPLEKR